VLPTVKVSVDDPPADTDVGLNEPVTPDGAPLIVSATGCVAPAVTAVVIVDVVVAPGAAFTDEGVALTEKSLAGGGGGGGVATASNAAMVLGVPRPVGPS
jgi:hypothetical protein